MASLTTAVESAKSEKGAQVQLVTFALDGEEFAVDVLGVREIIRMTDITKMPNAPSYVEGVINLRGMVVPVVSLRQRFSLAYHENDDRSRILVMDLEGGVVGFVVDAVAEVIRVASDAIQPTPDVAQSSGVRECIKGVLHRNERLLVVLDLNTLFAAEGGIFG